MSTESPVQKEERNLAEQQDAPRPEAGAPLKEAPADQHPEAHQTSEQPTFDQASEKSAVQEPAAVQESADTSGPAPAAEVTASPAQGGSASEAPAVAGLKPSFASRCFGGLAAIGPLALIFFWLIQSLPTLMGRELRALHEVGNTLTGNAAAGLPSPDFYPVYHWFMSGLSLIPGIETLSLSNWLPDVQPSAGLESFAGYPVSLLPLAAALSALCMVLLTWGLARATGNDRRTAFASGLVVLGSLAFIEVPRVAGSDMFLASIMTLCSICLYRGWIKPSAPLWLLSGFALIALSALAGGILGLALPLLTSLVFLFWRGTFRRAGARDGALGFGLMLVLLMTWGTLVSFGDGGRELLKALIENEYVAPIGEALALQGQDAWISPSLLAILWLPWTALLLFLPWGRIGGFMKALVTNRTQRPGQGWLWASFLVTLAVLSLLGANMPVLLMPLVPPLAVLTAQALRALSAGGSRGFFLLLALTLIVLGLLFAAANVYPAFFGETPAQLAALQAIPLPLIPALVQSVGLLLIGLLLWKATNRACADGALLVLTFLVLLYAAPLAYYTVAAPAVAAPAVQVETPAQPAAEATPPATAAAPEQQQSAAPAPAPSEPQATALPTPDAQSPAETMPEGNTAPAN